MGELSAAREIGAALALLVQVGCAAFVGARVGRAVGRDDGLLAVTAGAVAALATALVSVLVPAMLGILTLPAVLVADVVLVAATWRWIRVEPGQTPLATPSVLVTIAVGAAVAYAVLGLDLSLGPASLDFDTREYHVVNLASWLQEGSLWPLPYQSPSGVSATHPGDAELLGAGLALTTGGDELVYVVPVLFGALALPAGALLARELGGRAALGALAALAVLAAPLFFATQVSSLSTDVVVAASIVAALALLAAACHRDDRADLVGLTGVALGLALGSKYTALVPVFAVALVSLWALRNRRRWWWLVPGVVALAAPWYVRNLLATGNPLFPQELGPLGGGDSPFEVLDDTMLEHLTSRDRGIVGDWLELGARFVGPATLLTAGGVVFALARWRRDRVAAGAALVALAAFVGYLVIPYSGGGPLGFPHLVASSLRYSMTALLLGAVLLPGTAPRRLAGVAVAVVLAVDLWRLHDFVPDVRPDLGVTDGAIARALVLGAAVALLLRCSLPRLVAPVLAVALVVGTVAVLHDVDRGRTPTALEAALVRHGGLDGPVVPLGVVDLRSALGPRLGRELVAVSRGGRADEIPFATDDQVRRLLLGDTDAPPAPSSLATALDAALRQAPADLLAVGPEGAGAYPEGWQPEAATWCALEEAGGVTIYERCADTVAAP